MINFVIIGGGWRAEFYLRIAKALPDIFSVSAICVRNTERAAEIAHKYNVKTVASVEEVLREPFDFIVNCINKNEISSMAVQLADMGYYVLCETPIMNQPESKHCYDRIQVAEQFHKKGRYQAIKKLIDSGIIGEINHIHMSVAHDYHAMSLMRFFLQDDNKPKLLSDLTLQDRMVKTNGRVGVLEHKKLENAAQTIKVFRFNKATVVYDFNPEQYFSPIRKDRLLIRGAKGEIEDNVVRYLNDNSEPISSNISFTSAGLLDGFYCNKITFENQVLYSYPFHSARLSEEEMAIAECLRGMKDFVQSGEALYSYERAYHDYAYFMNK